MPTYAIGDVQGCLKALQALLTKIHYQPAQDILWFTGDLINRGPHSLETLRFISRLPTSTVCVLGNHDLALLAADSEAIVPSPKDSFGEILAAPDRKPLIAWLRQRPILHHDPKTGFTLTHAGIYPLWDLAQAQTLAQELEMILRGDSYDVFIHKMFGNSPTLWDDGLSGWDRARFITNAFTRMRFCTKQGALSLTSKISPEENQQEIPWFAFPKRPTKHNKLIFGHWAALNGKCDFPNVFALDTGCVWGNCLTAFCLETQQRTAVDCQKYL
jgi:bis(5'-nucleosyl)-tetraphosphatase (symmetrical)